MADGTENELLRLTKEIEEHLRFYRDIGIEEIAGPLTIEPQRLEPSESTTEIGTDRTLESPPLHQRAASRKETNPTPAPPRSPKHETRVKKPKGRTPPQRADQRETSWNEATGTDPLVLYQRARNDEPIDRNTPLSRSVDSSPPAPFETDLFGEPVRDRPETGSPATASPATPASPSLASALPVLNAVDSSLDAIREDIGDCRRCRLCEGRSTIVFGEGNPRAELMFIGEGPGAEEDQTGRPFVGRAGQLLNKIIEAIGMRREDVYIANIVKCRPPGNRNPERDEVATCEPFLFRQIACIKPRVIVALGTPAFQCLLRTRAPITASRGQWKDWNGIKLMPTFHPAYLLRSPDKKRYTWEDMKKVRDYLAGLSE